MWFSDENRRILQMIAKAAEKAAKRADGRASEYEPDIVTGLQKNDKKEF